MKIIKSITIIVLCIIIMPAHSVIGHCVLMAVVIIFFFDLSVNILLACGCGVKDFAFTELDGYQYVKINNLKTDSMEAKRIKEGDICPQCFSKFDTDCEVDQVCYSCLWPTNIMDEEL